MALPKNADALTAKINGAMAKLNADGTYKKIYDTWINLD